MVTTMFRVYYNNEYTDFYTLECAKVYAKLTKGKIEKIKKEI